MVERDIAAGTNSRIEVQDAREKNIRKERNPADTAK